MTQTVLIAGASGRFGAAAHCAFQSAGWITKTYNRHSETLLEAAQGVDVIVNALNPPDYKNWDTELPRITQEVIEAAKASGATVLLPGNVYNFGTQTGPWSDTTPHVAHTQKGQIRIDLEIAYKEAGIQTIVLRGGDFFGPDSTGSWLDLVMLKSLHKGKLVYPGNPDIPHAWAYLPDMARAAVMLCNIRGELANFCDVPFPGFNVSGRDIVQALELASGQKLKLEQMQWWPIKVASPFWRMGRELLEMRYLWDHPHELDGTKFRAFLPDFVGTSFKEAMAAMLPVDIKPNEPVIRAKALA